MTILQSPVDILVVTGSRVLADLPSAERWALHLLHEAVSVAGTVVTGDARGPDRWALAAARGAGRRWASYGLDGLVLRGHGEPVRWGVPDAADRENRAAFAAWCLHRDRVMVHDAARALAAGRSVRVLAMVAAWSTTHGTEYTAARARRAGIAVDVRVFGGR